MNYMSICIRPFDDTWDIILHRLTDVQVNDTETKENCHRFPNVMHLWNTR